MLQEFNTDMGLNPIVDLQPSVNPVIADEERAEMLSGFPFRMVGELQNAYSQFARLVGGMMQTPHPQSPDLPMAADPRLDLTPYLYRTLEALQKEMSYAGRYRPIDPTDEPSTYSSSSQQLRGGSTGSDSGSNTGLSAGGSSANVPTGYQLPPSDTSGEPQLPIRPYAVRPPIPIGSAEQQSLGIGVQQGGESPERTSPIPIPGSTVSADQLQPGELRNAQQPSYATIGDADLVSQPGLLAQLFPNFLESILNGPRGLRRPEPGKPPGGGRVRNRSTRNPK